MVPHYRVSEVIPLHILFFKNPISIQIKSISNPNQIQSFFCSSFFLCLQGQLELCGSYYLLQSCFSFFVRLHGQTEPFVAASFSSLALLSSSVSTADLSCLLETTFSSLTFLSYSFSSPRFNLMRVAWRCFSWSSVSDDLFFSSYTFWFSFLLYLVSVLSSAFLSVSEALFALSFSFLSERLLLFSIHAKAALAYSRNE